MPDVPYVYSRDREWTVAVTKAIDAKSITVDVREDFITSVTVYGTCPRCEDEFTVTQSMSTPVDLGGAGSGSFLKLPWQPRHSSVIGRTLLQCTCTGDHPGRPAGAEGCGIYFFVTPEKRSS